MPPKKGGKAKKGAKKDEGPEEGAPLTPEDEAKMYLATCQSLQMQLADRTEAMNKAQEEKRTLDEKVSKIQEDFAEEQKTAFEITRDMTRQYNGMQEQLVDRITQLSHTVQELQDKLEDAEQHLEKTMREKDRIISLKDEEISAMKAKMEDMAREFGGMLKETLDKMRERIELSSTNLDMEGPLIPPAHDIGEYGA
jgi:chromosome segregation ATPase